MGAHSDSDPVVTDTDGSNASSNKSNTVQEDDTDSGQSPSEGSWKPDTEDTDTSDIEIPAELVHLLAEGYTQDQLMDFGEQIDTLDELSVAMQAISTIPDAAKVLLDGGTFSHMFGTGTHHLLVNRRKVTPVPVSTAGGIRTLDEQADPQIGSYRFRAGYVNPHMDTTLISVSSAKVYRATAQGW